MALSGRSLLAMVLFVALSCSAGNFHPHNCLATEPTRATGTQDVATSEVPRTVDDLRALQDRVQKLSEQLQACTVGLRVGPRQGSGVLISKDGYVLTAAHVIDQAFMPATVILPDGRRLAAQTLGLNRADDAGLVKITPAEGESLPALPFAPMRKTADVHPGQWCVALGHPNGYQAGRNPVLRLGRILALNPVSGITTDCALVGGDSGGPLFDLTGQVIGVHSRIGASLALNIHVPVDIYHEGWERLKAGEQWGHIPGQSPFIGVRGDESDVARVVEVFPDSPAQRAGLKTGDIVLRFDGHTIGNFQSLQQNVANKRPNELVKLVVQRGTETLELELVVGKQDQ